MDVMRRRSTWLGSSRCGGVGALMAFVSALPMVAGQDVRAIERGQSMQEVAAPRRGMFPSGRVWNGGALQEGVPSRGAVVALPVDRVVWAGRAAKLCFGSLILITPAARYVALGAFSGALMVSVYFDGNRPMPFDCQPFERDKWQHCFVGCMLSRSFPLGPLSASVLAVVKEVKDAAGGGVFSARDIEATMEGIWDSPAVEYCERYCCRVRG